MSLEERSSEDGMLGRSTMNGQDTGSYSEGLCMIADGIDFFEMDEEEDGLQE